MEFEKIDETLEDSLVLNNVECFELLTTLKPLLWNEWGERWNILWIDSICIDGFFVLITFDARHSTRNSLVLARSSSLVSIKLSKIYGCFFWSMECSANRLELRFSCDLFFFNLSQWIFSLSSLLILSSSDSFLNEFLNFSFISCSVMFSIESIISLMLKLSFNIML